MPTIEEIDAELQRRAIDAELQRRDGAAAFSAAELFDPRPLARKVGEVLNPVPFATAIADVAPQMAGGALGAIKSAGKSTPEGMAVTGIMAGGGEAFKQIGQDLGVYPGKAPEGSLARMSNISDAAVWNALPEGAARVAIPALSKFLQRGLRGLSKDVMPEGRQAAEFMAKKGYPANFTPAQMTNNAFSDIMENVAEASAGGGGTMRDFKATQMGNIDNAFNAFAENVATKMDADELGLVFNDVIKENKNIAREPARKLYAVVDKKAGNWVVPSQDLKTAFSQDIMIMRELGGHAPGDEFLKIIEKFPDDVTFSAVRKLRSNAGAAAKKYAFDNMAEASRTSAMVADALDAKITRTLGEKSPELLASFENANKIWSDTSNIYKTKLVNSMVKRVTDRPEIATNLIFKNNGVTPIREARAAIGEEAWAKFQRAALEDIWDKSKNSKGVISGKKLDDVLFGRSGLGEEAVSAAFSPAQVEELKGFLNAAQIATDNPIKRGKMMVQLIEGGALLGSVGMAVSGNIGSAAKLGGILLIPKMLAKLSTTPTGIKLLTEGFTLPVDSPIAGRFAARMMAELSKSEGISEGKDMNVINNIGAALRAQSATQQPRVMQGMMSNQPSTPSMFGPQGVRIY